MKNALFSFIHCADLHLDSPFEGLHAVSPTIANVLRDATFRSFENVIDIAIREKVDFLIIAGDVYDGADRSLRAQWRFHQALRHAVESGLQCFVAHGNHDPLSGWEAGLILPDGVHRFDGNNVECAFARRNGETLAHIHGISYPSREIRENLALRFPTKEKNAPFSIGLLHCNVGGYSEHDNYAPCNLDDLLKCDMDYWALGHVHTRQVLNEIEPYIIYPGNTQGRSVREIGERGCYFVKVDDTGTATAEFVPTDVVRWFIEEVSISGVDSVDVLIETLLGKKEEVRSKVGSCNSILRLHLIGRGDLHKNLRRSETEIISVLREGEEERRQFVWVESVQFNTRPAVDIQNRLQIEDFVGEFLKASESLRSDTDVESAMHKLLIDPNDHSIIADQLESLTREDLLSILEDAEMVGLDWLLKEEE
jgi:DNA repair exonuclease SbcCD nuclease subunit